MKVTRKKQVAYFMFIYLDKAFNRGDRKDLWHMLENYEVRGNFLSVVERFY